MISCKLLQRSIKHQVSALKLKEYCGTFTFSTVPPNDRYIVPTHEQIKEYTKNIASVIHSWPIQFKEYFIATLHKAQANPKRNKNYNLILSEKSKIPQNYLHALDIDKLRHWLPFVYVTDIVQCIQDIQHSPVLATIHDGDALVTYNHTNPHHKQILRRIKTEHYNKMIWVRDVPMNVTDRKLAQIFSKFGPISAITMDRYQSVKQQKFIDWKHEELAQNQRDELDKTIKKLSTTVVHNAMNEYEQEYLKLELSIENKGDILRLIMAHLQHQFDIADMELTDDESLLIPVCFDRSVCDLLSDFCDATLFYEEGNIIMLTTSSGEAPIRDALTAHPKVSNVRKSGKPKDGMIELEIRFVSKLECSITDFIESLCVSYYNLSLSDLQMSHHIPHRIPQWWRDMHEQTTHSFFNHTVADTDKVSISQRINKVSTEGDEELTQDAATCSAFIYFADGDALDTVICSHTKLWGMVINGQRCRVSVAPTQIQLKNVPYDPWNPIRYTPLYTPHDSQHHIMMTSQQQYDADGDVIPPVVARSMERDKSHIPIASQHIQCGVPLIVGHCHGLHAVHTQTTRFEHSFSKSALDARLGHEAPAVVVASNSTMAEHTQLLMKHSDTINIGLPLIGGVIQYMLALVPMYDNHEMLSYDVEDIKHMPIVANKVAIRINRMHYVWKHASCAFEDRDLFWYVDDDVPKKAIKEKRIKKAIKAEQLFVRMGYVCVHSKRYRKVNIISHGLSAWDGQTPQILQLLNGKCDHSEYDMDWLECDIEDHASLTIAKSVNVERQFANKSVKSERQFDLLRGQQMAVFLNGIQHRFCDDMILHKGWNHLLIDFGLNDMKHGSFQIVDFDQRTEIQDLSWRYSPPPMSVILQFNDHLDALQVYDALKTVKQKRYGVKVELCDYDDKHLQNETVLQAAKVGGEEEMIDIELDAGEVQQLESFANQMISNIHESHKQFDDDKVYRDTATYEQILADYSPSQMLQYDEEPTAAHSNTTQLFNTKLNVPSTLELIDHI
eukprot:606362_1